MKKGKKEVIDFEPDKTEEAVVVGELIDELMVAIRVEKETIRQLQLKGPQNTTAATWNVALNRQERLDELELALQKSDLAATKCYPAYL